MSLRRHLRLFLPRPLARASQLSWRQRLHHANHGLDVALVGVRTLAVPLGALAGLSMILRNEVVEVPFELWIAAIAMLVGTLGVRWLAYRHLVKATLRQALGGALAYLALAHVITLASHTALVGRGVPWRRTNKSKSRSQGWAALQRVRAELLLALGCLGTSAVMLYLPEVVVWPPCPPSDWRCSVSPTWLPPSWPASPNTSCGAKSSSSSASWQSCRRC